MKLYNKSLYPDELLKQTLRVTGRLSGARTQNVVVKITNGRRGGHSSNGVCHHGGLVYDWHLTAKAARRKSKARMVSTDGAWLHITLQHPLKHKVFEQKGGCRRGSDSALELAANIIDLMLHEWAHVAEKQSPQFHSLPQSRRVHGRRPQWGTRPEEIRAENVRSDAQARRTLALDDAELALAEFIDGVEQPHDA